MSDGAVLRGGRAGGGGGPRPPRRPWLLLLAALLLAIAAQAAPAGNGPSPPVILPGTPGVALRKARIRLANLPPSLPPKTVREVPDEETEPPPVRLPVPAGLTPDPGGALAPLSCPGGGAALQSPPPASSFLALADDGSVNPPDGHGAVGPDHLMVTLNTEVRIQDRAGTPLVTVTLVDFWASLGFTFPFDPRVAFDPYAGRFITVATSGADTATASLLVGVSETADPTQGWLLYRIDADPADRSWADYPTLGFNRRWIVVTANMYGGTFHANLFALDKDDVYAGGAGRYTMWSRDDVGSTLQPAVTLDPDLELLYLIDDWNGDDAGMGVVRLFEIGGALGSETLTLGPFVAVTDPWSASDGGDFAPQLGARRKITTDYSSMQSLVYRNGSLWAAQTVFLPAASPTRSAVQWWELGPQGDVRQRGRVEDPAGELFFAFPSLAVSRQDDVLIGYARFSAATYASSGYSFRAAADPQGTLRDGVPLKDGEAPFVRPSSGRNRWGDYTHSVVDPANDLDLWTLQQFAALPVDGKDRWGMWWGRIAPVPCAPPLVAGPAAPAVCSGDDARLAVSASGQAPLGFQWRKDGSDLSDGGRVSGATTDALTLSGVLPVDDGVYDVAVTDVCAGRTLSSPAALTVAPSPPAAPGNVLHATRDGSTVTLTWTAAAGAAFHEIDRCAADVRPCSPATYGATPDDRFTDAQVPGRAYWYRLAAGNACGTSR